MVEEVKINAIIDVPSTFGPLIAAMLINAQYCALVLKQGNGDKVTEEMKRTTLYEVIEEWVALLVPLSKRLPH